MSGGKFGNDKFDDKEALDRWKADGYEFALRLLVNLKDYKDKHGKDEYYCENQPKAWDLARRTLRPKGRY